MLSAFPLVTQPRAESETTSASAPTVSISQFFDARPEVHADITLAVRDALAYCKKNGVSKLVFPKATYRFRRDRASEKIVNVSNNDSGLKRIAFLLDGFKDFEIDGGGSRFVFTGFIVPFLIENSECIALKNFVVDYDRTFHSEGKILAVGADSVDVSFSSEFPYAIRDGLLHFFGKPGDETTDYPAWDMLEFDADKRETAFMAPDYFYHEKRQAEELTPGQVRVKVTGVKATVGNIFVFGGAHRLVPGIILQDSREIAISDLTIHHSGGMGIIAQRCRTIAVERVKVTPSPGRMLSTTADATHFVNCSGKISLMDCLFENQSDDATNIHGIYAKITRKISPTRLEIRVMHPQQFGFDFVRGGTKLEMVKKSSLVRIGEGQVKSVDRLNGEISLLTFKASYPEALEVGDVVACMDSVPEVHIKHCTIRNNRARGILLGVHGPILVEENHFHSPGAAILLEGDGNFWFEQAGVRDLTVRRNQFDNCNFGVWGNAVIQVGAGIEPSQRAQSRYNRNIVIEDNLFRVFDQVALIHGYSIDGLTFRRNRIETTGAYPSTRTNGERFEITDSSNISIEE